MLFLCKDLILFSKQVHEFYLRKANALSVYTVGTNDECTAWSWGRKGSGRDWVCVCVEAEKASKVSMFNVQWKSRMC